MERETLKLALEALNTVTWNGGGSCWEADPDKIEQAIASIKAALAQPAQERNFCSCCGKRTADLTVIHTCTPPQEIYESNNPT
jgi:hypothetical protein